MTRSPRRPSPAARAVRRSRRPAARSSTFLERNRNRLLWIGGGAAVLALAFLGFVAPGLTPAYECANLFEPSPAPSFVAPTQAPAASGATAAPAATAPAAGFVEPDMGRTHVPPGTKVKYTWCPPASGNHYSAAGQGPIRAQLYGPADGTIPEGWVHNLEHGAIVLLYKCPGPGCTDDGQAELQALLGRWPESPICHIPPGGVITPVITRFDDMPAPYTALVWDMVLPMQTLNEADLFAFYAAYGEQFNPEKQCAGPSASPPAAATTAPATASPAPSAATSPAASPGNSTAGASTAP